MKLTTLVTSTLGLCSVVASAVAQRTPQAVKLDQLSRVNSGIVHLDSALYDEITQNPRDYSVSIVLTAMAPQYKCQPCQLLAPEYAAVAKSWQSSKERTSHYFAVLDFENGQAVYQKLRLQTAPTFQLFKPTIGPRASASAAPETINFGQSGFTAEAITDALRKAGINVRFKRPVDKSKLVLGGLSTIFSICGVYVAYRYAAAIFNPKFLWAVASGAFIITMTSGYMWNKIRNPPYTSRMQNGMTGYIAGGYQNQVGAETHIISAVYGVLALSTYVLAYVLPQLRNQGKQRLGVYVWTGIQFVMLGTLMNIFRLKQPGYPFKFF